MALRISSPDGVDLNSQPPLEVQIAASPVVGGPATITCLIIEDGSMPYSYVSGTLSWNDGTQSVVYNVPTSGTLSILSTRNLQPGDYLATVEGHNYNTPVWDTVNVNFPFKVRSTDTLPVVVPLLFGPILPKDSGYPNQNQWNWNRGQDLEILASSVKMLLTTSKGERIMQPEYGTNLRAILFELETVGIEGLVQQEIVDALTKWEPRVTLQYISVEKTGAREVTVNAAFTSKLNQNDFTIPMVFNP